MFGRTEEKILLSPNKDLTMEEEELEEEDVHEEVKIHLL
jgi:hypothetical protein